MIIRPGSAADLPQLRSLLHSSRSYISGGAEDLPDLLNHSVVVVGEEKSGGLWGFVAFLIEARPATLPASVPDRVPLRAAAMSGSLFSVHRLPDLLHAALEILHGQGCPRQLFAFTAHAWLNSALLQAGFQEVDQIRFYVRTQREVPQTPITIDLRPVQESDLDPLAQLDGETFASLWHMGRANLVQLCFTSRVQVAEKEGKLAGYTATAIQPSAGKFYQPGEAQIVRLAVHPSMQRQGIGRQLLTDSLQYAHQNAIYRVQLNTQESNKESQRLYEAFQFRRQGQNVPVFVKEV